MSAAEKLKNLKDFNYEWIAKKLAVYGMLVYLLSIFLLDSSKQNTIFYVFVGVPSLFLIHRLGALLAMYRWALASVLIFIVYLVVSSFWSGSGLDSFVVAIKYAVYVLCLILAMHYFCSQFDGQAVNVIVIGMAGIAMLLTIFLSMFQSWALEAALVGRSSLNEINGWGEDNPISSAIVVGLGVLACWCYFPKAERFARVVLLVLILTSMAIIFLTKSRGPALSLLVTVLVLCVLRRNKCDVILLIFTVVCVAIAVVAFGLSDVVLDRAQSPNYRLEIWTGAFESLRGDWLVGHGFGTSASIPYGSSVATHAHSTLLETFRVGGLVGLLLAALMVSIIMKGAVSQDVAFYMVWLLYGLLCLSTNGRLPLSRPAIEWVCFWMPLLFLMFFSLSSLKAHRSS